MATSTWSLMSTGGFVGGMTNFLAITPALGAALPLSFLLMSSVLPVVKVLLVAATGLLFALPSVGVLTAPARHTLSKLVFTMFLPAIIFVNLGESISLEKLMAWWFIPVNVIIASVSGCLIGAMVAKVTKAPPEFFRITFVLTGIGNMGNMPLVLLSAVCSDARSPFGDSKMCTTTGTAYISLGMWMAAIIMWGFVYNVVAPPQDWLPGYYKLLEERRELAQNGVSGKLHAHDQRGDPSEVAVHVPGEADKQESGVGSHEPQIPENDEVAGGPSLQHPLLQHASSSLHKASELILTSVIESKFNYWMKALHIYDILRPPVLAAFLAMVVGMIPPLEWLMFSSDGYLRFLIDSIAILGQAMIPCILLALGGNLVGGPGSSELPLRTTLVIVVTRLIVVPTIGIGVVLTADWLGWLPPDDKMFRFVLFMQHAMPSSIQIGTACSLRGFGEKEVSAVLFYQHLAAVVTMAFYLFIFFYILFG